MPSIPLLNWDILLLIIPLLEPAWVDIKEVQSIVHLMQTCRTLYGAGMPYLLRSPDYSAFSIKSAIAFNEFVLRDSKRPQFIRSMQIPDYWRAEHNSALTRSLAGVLAAAKDLEAITFDEAEPFFADSFLLQAAVATHRNLKTISLSGCGDRTVEAILELQSPVTSIKVDFGFESRFYQEGEADIARILSNISQHLEAVDIVSVGILNSDTLFPRTTTLTFREVDHLNVDAIIHSFPNVRVFSWNSSNWPEENFTLEDVEGMRSQTRNNDWPSLDYLDATIPRCYALHLKRPVRIWDVYLDANWLSCFPSTLRDIRPPRLTMCLNLGEWTIETLSKLLQMLCSINVTHLHFDLCIDCKSILPLQTEQDTIVDRLGALPHLTFTSLAIHGLVVSPAIAPGPADVYFTEMNYESYAGRFASFPKLEHLSFRISNWPAVNFVWEVRRDLSAEGGNVMVKLGREEHKWFRGFFDPCY
ncbi:hypothetical protein BXZ70DRAFT_566464 [Cristinia sonorae]|uniref:F-box domain-containing protein n=1 Tax=Cristinia sonorae TaxID=1940300 RepID=A0A8K0UFA6_9AGAR|nr:hypothetical protein BXZ70DRAFT_566464 [Cristinia sonorae]